MAWRIEYKNGVENKVLRLTEGNMCLLGRGPHNDINILHRLTSKNHGILLVSSEGDLHYIDEGSTNGTFHANRKMDEQGRLEKIPAHTVFQLQDNSVLSLVKETPGTTKTREPTHLISIFHEPITQKGGKNKTPASTRLAELILNVAKSKTGRN